MRRMRARSGTISRNSGVRDFCTLPTQKQTYAGEVADPLGLIRVVLIISGV